MQCHSCGMSFIYVYYNIMITSIWTVSHKSSRVFKQLIQLVHRLDQPGNTFQCPMPTDDNRCTPRHTRHLPMFFYCWVSVADAGPTSIHRCASRQFLTYLDLWSCVASIVSIRQTGPRMRRTYPHNHNHSLSLQEKCVSKNKSLDLLIRLQQHQQVPVTHTCMIRRSFSRTVFLWIT